MSKKSKAQLAAEVLSVNEDLLNIARKEPFDAITLASTLALFLHNEQCIDTILRLVPTARWLVKMWSKSGLTFSDRWGWWRFTDAR